MHEITHTTGDAILHGWRRARRRWKAREKLQNILANQSYRRSRHRVRRAQRRKFTFYAFFFEITSSTIFGTIGTIPPAARHRSNAREWGCKWQRINDYTLTVEFGWFAVIYLFVASKVRWNTLNFAFSLYTATTRRWRCETRDDAQWKFCHSSSWAKFSWFRIDSTPQIHSVVNGGNSTP